MQPTPPSAPATPPAAPRPAYNSSSIIVGALILVAFVYLADHVGKGEAAVFGGVERHITEQDFHRTQCTAVFGGCKIDLRDAQITGSEAFLDTYAIFGGIEIRVPEDWEIVNHGVAVFGGISDHRRHGSGGPKAKSLVIGGAAIFGGVDIKD